MGSLEYNHISLHAISRDLMVFPHTECLYMMIDTKLVDSEPSTPVSTPETSDDEPDDGEGMTEVRFAPDEKANLQVMFSSMSHCQSLHPDPEGAENIEEEEDEDYAEDGDGNGMYDDADEVGNNGDNNG